MQISSPLLNPVIKFLTSFPNLEFFFRKLVSKFADLEFITAPHLIPSELPEEQVSFDFKNIFKQNSLCSLIIKAVLETLDSFND